MPRGHDLRLASGSPCIDSGKNWAVPEVKLTVRSTLLEDNLGFGVKIKGKARATLERCTVRRTKKPVLVTLPEMAAAAAIWVADPYDLTGKTPRLDIKDSLVEKTEGFGLVVHNHGVANLERAVIRETARLPGGVAPAIDISSAEKDPRPPDPVVSLKCSMVDRTPGVGIRARGARVQLEQSRINKTTEPGGDGISIHQDKHSAEASLHCSVVENSARAGLIFFGGKGKICSSVFRGGEFAVVLQAGANPVICDDNRYEENTRTGVSFGQALKPVKVLDVETIKDPEPKR